VERGRGEWDRLGRDRDRVREREREKGKMFRERERERGEGGGSGRHIVREIYLITWGNMVTNIIFI